MNRFFNLMTLPAILAGATLAISGCSGVKPDNLGVADGKLAPCPDSPNCVSSDESPSDQQHYIKPLKGDWLSIPEIIKGEKEMAIISRNEAYIHATSTSKWFRYVDDIELHHRPDEGIIAIRSASRVGYGDMGVNRKRVERIRTLIGAKTGNSSNNSTINQ